MNTSHLCSAAMGRLTRGQVVRQHHVAKRSSICGGCWGRRRFSSRTESSSEATNLPLAGLRILDLSRVLAGPFCTQILGDYGASVIKVEQPGVGDETRHWRAADETKQIWNEGVENSSLYFSSINRNKRSITLNLKSPKGIEIVKKLATESDVVVHNFIPGAVDKMGLSYEDLKKDNYGLIYASVSGYGTTGPNRKIPGYDAIALAESGLLHITGEANGNPSKPGVAIGDMCTGLYVHGAILAALVRRSKTGEGANIEGSLFETGLSLLTNVGLNGLNLDLDNGGQRRRGQRWGLQHPSLTPYGGFSTKDGKMIFIAANNNRQWKLLCDKLGLEVVDDPRFATNDDRLAHRDRINEIVSARLKEKTKYGWMQQLEGSGLPYGAINDVVEAVEHPQASAREMIVDIDGVQGARSGKMKLIAPAVKIGGVDMSLRSNPPMLGEHTVEILDELGYSDAEKAAFKESGDV